MKVTCKDLLIKVPSPKYIVLYNQRHNPGLQLCHEGILSGNCVYVFAPLRKVEILQMSVSLENCILFNRPITQVPVRRNCPKD